MSYKPIITRTAVIFDLKKPIYGSFFGIWDKWLNNSGRKRIVVNTPFGKATFKSSSEYIKKAKRMERYYKNPEVPMIFYGLDFLKEIKERDERKKAEKKLDSPKIEYDTKLKLAQRIRDRNPKLARRLKLI